MDISHSNFSPYLIDLTKRWTANRFELWIITGGISGYFLIPVTLLSPVPIVGVNPFLCSLKLALTNRPLAHFLFYMRH